MKLEFKILWFDDQPKELTSQKGMLTRHLMKEGFKLNIKEVTQIKDIKSLLPSLQNESNPDLILMDWNMGNGTQGAGLDGADVAKKIRSKFKYQEIVFYSAAPPETLRKAVFDKKIDGVFCINRNNLAAETKNVIDTIFTR